MALRRRSHCNMQPLVRIFAAATMAASTSLATAGGPEPTDWPAFLGRHDMRFTKLPQGWTEAPHFGNAMIGSMLYQDGGALKLQVFRADVHDHRDSPEWGWTAYSRPRMEIGHFLIHPQGRLIGCDWKKDLWNAELTGTITTDAGEIRIRHFTHAIDMVIVTELTPSAGESGFRWSWHPVEAITTRPGYPADATGLERFADRYGAHYRKHLRVPWQPNPPGRMETRGQVNVWIQDLLAGGQYATAWAEHHTHGIHTHAASIANSHPQPAAAATAVREVRRFLESDRHAAIAAHRAWWHGYYPRSFVSLPDKSLESLYWQTIYRFGCTSRTGRGFVDTAGLWFQGRSWPYFTADWNIQAAHWPVYAANRLEQGRDLVDRLHRHRQTLVDNVRPVEWQADSAYLALAVAGDLRGTREDDVRYRELLGNLPWTMHNAWWQYRYSMDEAMLRETVFPLLRRAINHYLHIVTEEADGSLRLQPTYSPELGVFEDCNFDLALLKWGCHILLHASARLGIDDPLAPRWRELTERLPDFPADQHGFRLGADATSPASHQHLSHLLMIHPLFLVNREQDGTMPVLRRSFERAFATAGPGNRQAMVQAHAGPIAAALGLGNEALDSLELLRSDLLPNGLWYASPCIESTLAAATIIQDMLVQSWSDPAKPQHGPIRIFPALPAAWKNVEFHNLRTEGAFLVSAKRENGRTRWIEIESLAGEPCLVRPNLPGPFQIVARRDPATREIEPGIFQIDLRQGETIRLLPAPSPAAR